MLIVEQCRNELEIIEKLDSCYYLSVVYGKLIDPPGILALPALRHRQVHRHLQWSGASAALPQTTCTGPCWSCTILTSPRSPRWENEATSSSPLLLARHWNNLQK